MSRAPTREITDLTICRALFAAWVFAYHVDLHAHFSQALGPAEGLVRRGYLGVDGFFLLSGLILARTHPEFGISPTDAWGFWAKRLARIYPVHLAVLVLLSAVVGTGLALGLSPRDPGRFTLISLAENLALVQGWGMAPELAWNYPSWSISTEWAGYLLFPLLCFAVARLPTRLNLGVLPLCMAVLVVVASYSGCGLNLTFAHSLYRFFPEFLAGICTARLLPAVVGRLPGPACALVGLAVVLSGLSLALDVLVVVGFWVSLSAFTMQAAAGAGSILPRLNMLRFLGVLSYSFYMSFGTIELFLAQLFRHYGWNPAAHALGYGIAMTGLTFLLALTLHSLVENPARAFVDRRLKPTAFTQSVMRA